MKKSILLLALIISPFAVSAQTVDYSVVSIESEKNLNLSSASDIIGDVVMPLVKRSKDAVSWWTGNVLAQLGSTNVAYLYVNNGKFGIGECDAKYMHGRKSIVSNHDIVGFCFSPDSKSICYSETQGERHVVCLSSLMNVDSYTEVSSSGDNYSPVFSSDGSLVYYCCVESGKEPIIKSYDTQRGITTDVVEGMNPEPTPDGKFLLYSRRLDDGSYSIWKVNLQNGIKTCLVRQQARSFTSPAVSPDGNWIAMTGNCSLQITYEKEAYSSFPRETFTVSKRYNNTDIYVCRIDGSDLHALTCHAADDISPIWSRDGKHIYFVSQRGSSLAKANIWRMGFNEE